VRSPAPSSPPMAIPVRPVARSRLPLAIAQRLDVLIDLLGMVPIQFRAVEGKRARTGIVLAASGAPVSRLPQRPQKMRRRSIFRSKRRLEASPPGAARARLDAPW